MIRQHFNLCKICHTDPVSRESVELMESCMCVVCLDDPAGLDPSDANRASLMLHGGGQEKNGANRWYDKPLQVRRPQRGLVYQRREVTFI